MPTRKDTIPHDEVIDEGCLELPEINLNCFVIPANIEVTDCGKRFDFRTHLYGHQLDDYHVDVINETYLNEGTDYEIWGRMKQEIFDRVLLCFRTSKSVKWKYRKPLIGSHFLFTNYLNNLLPKSVSLLVLVRF